MPEENPIVNAVGEKLGEVAVAFLAILYAIKKQPGFDCALFESHIREALAASHRPENAIVRAILEESIRS